MPSAIPTFATQPAQQTPRDSLESLCGFTEPVSSVSHLLATAAFFVAAISLVRSTRGNAGRTAAVSIYAFSVVLLFSMSGVYHLLPWDTAGRAVLQRLDHASIFVLVAGTFTAVHGVVFRGVLRWGIITLVWVVTATAIPLKTVYFHDMPEWLGLTLYLAFPWIGLLTGVLLWIRRGLRYITVFMLGGVAYTVGAVFDFLRWPDLWPGVIHAHELFHFFVILGAALHWRFCATIAAEAREFDRDRLR